MSIQIFFSLLGTYIVAMSVFNAFYMRGVRKQLAAIDKAMQQYR